MNNVISSAPLHHFNTKFDWQTLFHSMKNKFKKPVKTNNVSLSLNFRKWLCFACLSTKKKKGGVRKYDDKEKKNCYKQCNTFTLMNNLYDEGQSFFILYVKECLLFKFIQQNKKKNLKWKIRPIEGLRIFHWPSTYYTKKPRKLRRNIKMAYQAVVLP